MSRGKEKSLGTITRNRAIKIFEALGFKTANKWDTARLQKKLIKLDVLVGGTELDIKTQKRVGEILGAQKKGRIVTVVDVEKAETNKQLEQDVKDAERREADRKAEKKKQAVRKEKGASKKKTEKTSATKKQKTPGVIMSILEFVKSHGPISEEKILSLLKRRFPDRNPESMGKTIKAQLPNRMSREKSINIKVDNEDRFYIGKGEK